MTTSSSDTAFRLRRRPRPMAAHRRRVGPTAPQPAKVTFCVRGVISPILMNLFMHYAFDSWMKRTYPQCPFARYADDAVVHCRSQAQAEAVMRSIALRLEECGLTMHPDKSKIVYCKDSNRTCAFPNVQFTFLGFTFRPREALNEVTAIGV